MKELINMLRENKTVGFLVATLIITIMLFLTLFLYGKTLVAFKESELWGSEGYAENTISIDGTGEVIAIPDTAQFSFTVSERSESSDSAQKLATEKINDVIAALEAAGVDKADIKTTAYNIYPNYTYRTAATCDREFCYDESVITSYEVSQTTEVKVRKVDTAGDLLTLIGQKGIGNISGLEFVVDDKDVLAEEARALAIADARTKAQKIANELGVELVRVISYYESNPGMDPMPYYDGLSKSAEIASAPVISTGESEISKTVTITYEIK